MKNAKLGELSGLVMELKEYESALDGAEKVAKEMKTRIARISEEIIPELMAELGFAELTLSSGKKLKVEKLYFAKIPDKYKDQAFQWLSEKGLDSIIKNEITTYFGKGESEYAQQLQLDLDQDGRKYDSKETIHPQTLKALVRERMEAGEEIPEDIFGIFVKNVTKIK